MENQVDELFTEHILKAGLHLFDLEESYKKLGDFENYVFEVKKQDRVYILRATHQSHRVKEDILAELHWVNYLHSNGINVPEVFSSAKGETVEEITAGDGSHFYFCMFSKVKGNSIHVKEDRFNEELFFAWGKAIGKMHKATRAYNEAEELKRRPSWNDDDLLAIENYIPSNEKIIVSRTKELLQELAALPTTKEYFGLIHGDIHSGNFFFDGRDIHIFDFDDSSYHWFTSDIAIPLYYSVFYRFPNENAQERNDFAHAFITAFTKGYETERMLPPQWKEHLSYMLRLRDVTLYSVLYKKIPIEQRDERLLKMLGEIGTRIMNKEPIVSIKK
jgi:amicoumacin kinase